MIILSVDGATPVAGVAIVKDGILLAEEMLNVGNTHSVQLMPMVVEILEKCNLTMQDIDAVVTSKGPGSFTGLRIGMATAKGLVQGSGCKLVAIPTLDVLAANLWGAAGWICPIMNAKKNEVYTALYRFSEGKLCLHGEYRAMGPKELADELKENCENIWFIGDGVSVYRDLFTEILGAKANFSPLSHCLSRAGVLAMLGYEKALVGEFEDLFTLVPLYVRKSEAEVRWEASHPGESIG